VKKNFWREKIFFFGEKKKNFWQEKKEFLAGKIFFWREKKEFLTGKKRIFGGKNPGRA
tara:strand:+ start:912 stop:1085 length:174 start_codon:yes stop_codon:yes gene_type:complete